MWKISISDKTKDDRVWISLRHCDPYSMIIIKKLFKGLKNFEVNQWSPGRSMRKQYVNNPLMVLPQEITCWKCGEFIPEHIRTQGILLLE